MWPHRRQPTRLLRPWDSPGKNTGVGCHFLLQCMKMKGESEVTQSCPTLSDPMDCSPPGPSIHGIFQARVLEWGSIARLIFFLAEIISQLGENWQTLMKTHNLLMYYVFYGSWGWGKQLIFVSGPFSKTQDVSNKLWTALWFLFFFFFLRGGSFKDWCVMVGQRWLKRILDPMLDIPVDLLHKDRQRVQMHFS